MSTVPTKPDLEAKYAEFLKRADALKATFTQSSMVKYVGEATEDLDDARDLLQGTAATPAVLMTVDFYLGYAAAALDQLEGVLRKYGKDAQQIG
jgi:hypothetical protein